LKTTELRSGGSRHLKLAFAHDALGQLARVELAIRLQMAQANVGDLAFLKKPWLTMY
jgi:hypothetical protein